MFSALRALILLIAIAPAAAPAATLSFDGLYAFGDSLSDNGNAYRLSFGFVPESPPYYEGRFSNGPIWYDHVARAFRKEGFETRNYAVGGARARANLDPIPDLDAQRRVFRDRADPGQDALAAIWAGGNDLLAGIGEPRIGRVARRAADAVADTAAALHRSGVDTALIFNMPDFADIPRYAESKAKKRASATRGARKFNARLGRNVEALREDGLTVIEVDTFAIFADVVADPGAYGIEELTRPCLRGDRDRCSEAEARATAFFDTLHPGATLHAILAEHVLDLLDAPAAPIAASLVRAGAARSAADPVRLGAVPLPAPALLLLAALGGLAALARRRRPAAPPG